MTTDKLIEPDVSPAHPTKAKAFLKGTLAMMPLTIAVVPWGILAGSFAIEVGLTPIESQAMSAIIFAGAAQLVALGMVKAGIGLWSILITTLLITSRHLLYAMAMRSQISPLPLKWRLTLGFLLTDELFALAARPEQRQVPYLFGAGLCFYLFWVVASIAGIVLASMVPNLQQYHLDFSIVAIFIPIIVILLKNRAAIAGLVVTTVCVLVMKHLQLEGAMIVSGMAGMLVAALIERQKEAA